MGSAPSFLMQFLSTAVIAKGESDVWRKINDRVVILLEALKILHLSE